MLSSKEIQEQFAMVWAAPIPFVVAVLTISGIEWGAFNWAYSSSLSSKGSQIELQDRQIADCKEKLKDAPPSNAKGRIDTLEARVGRVEPRRLSDEQKKKITENAILPVGASYALSIESDMGCPDCNQYAEEFSGILSKAHWTIRTPMVERPGTKSPKGIAVLSPDPSNPLPPAAALIRALKAADIPFDLMSGSDMNFGPQGMATPISAMAITAKITP